MKHHQQLRGACRYRFLQVGSRTRDHREPQLVALRGRGRTASSGAVFRPNQTGVALFGRRHTNDDRQSLKGNNGRQKFGRRKAWGRPWIERARCRPQPRLLVLLGCIGLHRRACRIGCARHDRHVLPAIRILLGQGIIIGDRRISHRS